MPLQHWRAQIKPNCALRPARSRANAEGTSRQWTQRSPPLSNAGWRRLRLDVWTERGLFSAAVRASHFGGHARQKQA